MTAWEIGSTRVVRWRPRPVLSIAIRLAVFIVPLVLAAETDLLWIRRYPPPTGVQPILVWVAEILVISAVVLGVTRFVARRLLPLAALLKVSLAFPDVAPSRLEVARRRPRAGELERETTHAYVLGDTADEAERAETVLILALALSAHDERTRAHTERVRLLAQMLGEKMQLIRDDRDRLNWAAVLHDIGKLTIAPAILNKPGELNEEEWAIIRQHPEEGARLARSMLPWLGEELGQAVEQHHEHYDGSGYPKGLEGGELSRLGRALAVVDSFEVMTAAHPRHPPMTVRAARKELERCSGTQFDPAVVRSFGRIPAARIYLALGPMSLISILPVVRRLPSSLGRALAPVANIAVAVLAAAVVLAAMEGVGRIHLGSPTQPPRFLAPVTLTQPGTFTHLVTPFTTSHAVASIPGGALGLIEDTGHIYVSGYAGAIDRFPLTGGSADKHAQVGSDSSLVFQRGKYYFAARGTTPGTPNGVAGIYTFDPDTLVPGGIVAALTGPLGMVADPQGNSLFVVAAGGIYRIDGLGQKPSASLLVKGQFDGVTVNADGSRIYVPSGQSVLGFDRSGTQVLAINVCCHSPDGLVVLGDGSTAGGLDVSGDVFVNANDGTILQVDTYHGNKVTIVASGGLRGDFMSLGIDGCLYATQGPMMVRLEPCFTTTNG